MQHWTYSEQNTENKYTALKTTKSLQTRNKEHNYIKLHKALIEVPEVQIMGGENIN